MSEIRTIVGQRGVETVIPPCPYQRENFTFVGWNTDRNASTAEFPKDQDGNTKVTLDQDTVLYAIWRRTTFRVEFDPNGGDSDVDDKYIEVGHMLGELPSAVRENYDFDGWYSQSIGGSKVSGDTIVNHDMTLFAQWIARTQPEPEPPQPEPEPPPTPPAPPPISTPPVVVFDVNDLVPTGKTKKVYHRWESPPGTKARLEHLSNGRKTGCRTYWSFNTGELYTHSIFTDHTYVKTEIAPGRNMRTGSQILLFQAYPPIFEYHAHDILCWYLMKAASPKGISQETGIVETEISARFTPIVNSIQSQSIFDYKSIYVYIDITYMQSFKYPGLGNKVWGFIFWPLVSPLP